jgi:uncharacterized lipoprotein YajG
MKKITILLLTALLSACVGSMPKQADLVIETGNPRADVYPPTVNANVIGRDDRSEPYVIVYDEGKEQTTKLLSRTPVHIQMKETLENGLRRQGLNLRDGADIAVVVVIKKLLARVTRPGTLYTAKAISHIRLLVENKGSTLTLDYNRETKSDSLTRPKVLDLEMMLNDQLSDITKKILDDDRVRAAIMDGRE